MPDLGLEAHLGRLVGILWGERDVDLEETAMVNGVLGAINVALPVAEVIAAKADLDVGFLRLNERLLTVFAKSSNSFFIRKSFFMDSKKRYYNKIFLSF